MLCYSLGDEVGTMSAVYLADWGKEKHSPCAATVSSVIKWCNRARDIPDLHVGHWHVSSIGPRSPACLDSPNKRVRLTELGVGYQVTHEGSVVQKK